MKKVFVFLSLIFFLYNAFATDVTNNVVAGCNGSYLFDALFVPKQINCSVGYYLPANHETCVACPNGYTCSGGIFSFNETEFQGAEQSSIYIIQNLTNMCATNAEPLFIAEFAPKTFVCDTGYYLPANTDGCTICPTNSFCVGGTYTFNETVAQGIQSCPGNTPHSPSGSAVCYAHVMHVGDDVMYMRSTKLTTPSLNIKIGNDIFYINMTTVPSFMNKNSLHYFKAMYNDTLYYICDDTTCPE